MEGQSSIPVSDATSPVGACRWCGTPTTKKLQVTKPRYTTAANGARVVAKPALEEWCCDTHLKTLQRTPGWDA